MRTDDEAISIKLANRHFLYRYLWRAYAAAPDEAFLDIVRSDHALQACSLVGDDEGRLQQGLASAVNGGTETLDLDALRSAYTRLFEGPAALPAPPWESVYASGENLIFQQSTLEVRAAYREAGYQAAGYPHEADDHLATELAFMAELAKRASEAYEDGDAVAARKLLTTQGDFLDQHLCPWVGMFADRLTAHAAPGAPAWYASFAHLCAGVCRADAKAWRA